MQVVSSLKAECEVFSLAVLWAWVPCETLYLLNGRALYTKPLVIAG